MKYRDLKLSFWGCYVRRVSSGLPFGLFNNLKSVIFIFTLLFFLIGFGNNGLAQTSTQTFTSSGTFIIPAGVSQITVETWGAGGGGGGMVGGNTTGVSRGGGGGAYAKKVISGVTAGTIYQVVVGTGGSGGNKAIGANGLETAFISNATPVVIIVKAAGGNGGTTVISGAGGAGGSVANSIGDLIYKGGDGNSGGGGGAGSKGAGGNTSDATSGAGTISNGGNGGSAPTGTDSNGNPGSLYGGGGSGASKNTNGGGQTGGNGANGYVVISWCTPANITTQPSNTTITYGSNAGFDVDASSGSTYQWQVNPGSGWTDITGATGQNLTVILPTVAMNGYQYRCNVSIGCGSVLASNAATLTVNRKALTVKAGDQTVTYGTIKIVVTQNATYSLSGFVNGENSSVISGPNTISYTTSFGSSTPAGTTASLIPDVTGFSASNYSFTTANGTISVTKANQYVVFNPLSSNLPLKDFTTVPLNANASSGLPVTLILVPGSPATLNGDPLNGYYLTNIGQTGTIIIHADQAGNSNYYAATRVTQNIDVSKSNQSISFPSINNTTYFNGLALMLEATASSGLPVTYSVVSGPASLFGNSLNISGAGDVWVTASQSGNSDFNAAESVTKSFTVTKGKQTITIDVEAGTLTTSTKITPTSTSGLPVVLTLGAGSAATGLISHGSYYTLTGIGPSGTIFLVGNQAGDANFLPADEKVQTIDLSKQNQIITFNNIPDQTYSPTLTVNLSALASSGLTVSYELVSGPATLTGSTLNISGAGILIVKASQSGNSTYNAAPSVTQDFTVIKALPVISLADIIKTYGDPDFSITPTSNSSGTLSITSSNVLVFTLSGNSPGTTATIKGAGTANLVISQEPSANYYGNTKTVLFTVNKANSIISFSGNSFTFNENRQGPTASITGSTGSISYLYTGTSFAGASYSDVNAPISAGNYSVVATVTGDANYNETISIPFSFTINKANAVINVTGYNIIYDALEHEATGTAIGVGNINVDAGLNLSSTKHTDAGTYNDTWTFQYNTKNYNDASGTVSNIIQRKNLSITAMDQMKCYGNNFTFSGNEYISSGLISGQTIGNVTLTSSGTGSGAAVGVYNIVPSNASGGSFNPNNYSINYLNGNLTVEHLPTLTGAAQSASVCDGTPATINLTGLVPLHLFSLDYSINNVPQATISGLYSGDAGTSGFSTPPLTMVNNSQILKITGITFSDASNCSQTFNQNVTLSVNPLPALTSATQVGATCSGIGATISLTGLIPGTVSKVYYTINASDQTPASNVVADGSGNASFTTSTLTTANNGQTLQIYGIEITGITPTCFNGITQNLTLTVTSLPTASIASNNSPVCSGSDATFTLTGNSGATVTYYINSGSNTTVTLTGGTATVTVSSATADQTLTLVSVADTNCSQSLSGSSTITVTPIPIIGSFN